MRRKFICGNWKMNSTGENTRRLVGQLSAKWLPEWNNVEVAICPPFTSIAAALEHLFGAPIQVGAQNAHFEKKGAFTGEISPVMLAEMGCSYVILGHSERREYFKETDGFISKKVCSVLEVGIRPILCIGETLTEREAGVTNDVLARQLEGSLYGVSDSDMSSVTIAYEPVWAIGTGKTATPAMAQEAHAFIRATLAELYNQEIADSIIIQYGGSMKPDNAFELLSQPDIDGGLIGGASLEVESFCAIIAAAAKAS